MEFLYYKSEKGNFGDDLNPWLWEHLFEKENKDDSMLLIGIGSVLSNDFSFVKPLRPGTRKIVFGSGIRATYNKFKVDDTWDIRFLRGPLSSASLKNKYKYITDAAYAMRKLKNFNELKNVEKKYEVGLMPYFKSMQFFDFESICNTLGYRFISPHSENGVEYTIKEIASCKTLITEAMHGAIVADILRVPWNRYVLTTPFTEGQMVSEFKWLDWQYSVEVGNIDVTFINFYMETRLNAHIRRFTSNVINAEFLLKKRVKKNILDTLSAVKTFYLSDDSVIDLIDNKLEEEIEILKSSLAKKP